ncbi:MAG TPA: XRE family transcriptional regulator [Selenomonas sp.]|nr:XRE family transcriptional regulator [Selenomonas sp.]
MVTAFGKFCRKLRIDRGQIMLNMAESLQVSPAFLSAVENGKKNIPAHWGQKIIELYRLSEEKSQELLSAIEKSKTEVRINLSEHSEQDRNLAIVFAREFDSLNEEQKEEIFKMLRPTRKE